jgi:hypothetical protein
MGPEQTPKFAGIAPASGELFEPFLRNGMQD